MLTRDGMGREEGSGWGTHVYLWWIHVDIWQNQYNIVKLKKIKLFDTLKKNKVCLKIWKGKYSRFVLLKNFIAIHRSLFFDVNLRITAIF